MEKFFALSGKVVFGLLVMAILAGAGFYAGKRLGTQRQPSTEVTTTASPTPQLGSIDFLPSPTPTALSKPKQTVTGGVPASAGLSFERYAIEVPQDWIVSVEKEPAGEVAMHKLIISQGGYRLQIFQAATGGSICLYPGDPDSEGPSSRFDAFMELTTADGKLMRRGTLSASMGKKGYTVCQKSVTYGNFQQPTNFGHISYTTPANPQETVLKEMDEMIASLKKS